ncbi:DNA polymerase theta subunit [Capronia coronata CBS 617.96]|uniref:DNA polymerase theta subunit n=1 Tax=Capronia coronata CBS 617.96 TaxID=1182541 RepID=W9Y744_9EURO|nr:DNA polymerase theta subunit [Capronia coronata CBS 617.96]EXJ85435.1 DNA polymerase theta subunit [Capronia coronata CBS 617.96]
MATAWPRSAVVYGQPTTLDLARNQTYRTGSKRPGESVQSIQRIAPNHDRFSLPQVPLEGLPGPVQESPSPLLQASPILPPVNETLEGARTFVDGQPLPLRAVISSTPGPSQNPLLTLRHPVYGLPPKLVENLEALGVHAIYPWQSSCLLRRGLLTGEQNLVYTAPTGGGKSLVADVLLLKRVIENPGKKGILVLPYVALVQEKSKWLRFLVEGVSKNVDEVPDGIPNPTWRRPSSVVCVSGFFGGSRAAINWSDCDVAVCTIEKANSLVNAAVEEGKDAEIAVLVLDELHMLNDEHRGYLMELLATKLMSLESPVQIVGMSATLPNPQLLAKWLNAKYYIAKYRPVPIEEHLVYDHAIYPTANAKEFFRTATQLTAGDAVPTQRPQPRRTISKSEHQEFQNPLSNAVVALAVETALAGHGALVFCSSRLGVERTASLISDALPVNDLDQEILNQRQDLLASLHALPSGFEATFSKTLPRGVGFHHAGLTIEERTLVASAYDTGILRVMVATCSLAAGINLPARRVILNGARMGRDLVGPAMLLQMRGRAGRKGKDEVGETYLCCQKSDLEAVAQLLEAEMPPVESCLTPEKRGVKRALLEVIGVRMASSKSALDHSVCSSLLWHTAEHSVVAEMVDKATKELLESGLIQLADHENCLEPTRLGTAVVASALSPEGGIFVHSELRRALESFTSGLAEISWPTFRNELDSLDESGLRAIRLIGVSPALVNRLANSGGDLKENNPDEIRLARVYRRTYSAFQLRDLCNEISVHEISIKYSVPRGHIQTLAQTCHGFAAGMIKFCDRMGWGMLAAVLEHMLDRLRAGAKADLLEMAQVAFIKSRMARIFWENGFKSVRALGEADPQSLVPVMMQAQARKMRLQGEAAEKFKEKLLARAEIIVNSATRVRERQQQVEWEEE